ncbi:MAG TPA: VOC family protein [Aggregatilineales bacterium]|nr:VOC family protein [Aggregatilineales bacterium]
MFDCVGTVCLFVNDQDVAKNFYVNKLGFELRQDMPMGPSSRWVAVAPKGAKTEVVLYKLDQNWEHYKNVVGKSQAITFNVTDMKTLAANLKARGVRFTLEPEVQPWGSQAVIVDDEGNGVVLVEPAPASP